MAASPIDELKDAIRNIKAAFATTVPAPSVPIAAPRRLRLVWDRDIAREANQETR